MDQLDRIESKLDHLLRITIMSATATDANFAALQTQVTQNTTVEASAVTLLNGLAAQLAAAISASENGDSAALPALQQQLQSSATALAAAITANTPSAPPAS
jgi:uncharacterized membrane protein affecting hemolysin expression